MMQEPRKNTAGGAVANTSVFRMATRLSETNFENDHRSVVQLQER